MSTLNMTEMTTPSQNVSKTTTEISIGEFMEYNVAVWVHLAIMIVGLITNPLILIVLRKKNFGSKFAEYLYVFGKIQYKTYCIRNSIESHVGM